MTDFWAGVCVGLFVATWTLGHTIWHLAKLVKAHERTIREQAEWMRREDDLTLELADALHRQCDLLTRAQRAFLFEEQGKWN